MKQIINVAIIGCGRVAGHHLRAINRNPLFKIIALCDLREERRLSLMGDSQIPHYSNYHEMFEAHPEIELVAIITPSGMHFEHALEVIEKYGKNVVIEKPVVMTIEQGEQLALAAKNRNLHVFPVHQYRFNRCVQRIRKAISQGELGNIVLATVRMRWCRPQNYYDRDAWRGTFALDGGCCTNQGIHHLDLLRYLVGEVKRVNVVMRTFGASIEVEDTVIANLEFESGALGLIEITTAARPTDYESSLSVVGSAGLAMLGGWATDKLVTFSPAPEDEEAFSDVFEDAYGLGHNDIYAGAYSTMVEGGSPAVELLDARKTIELLHAMYLSDERQDWVEVKRAEQSSRLGMVDDELASLYRTKAEKPTTR